MTVKSYAEQSGSTFSCEKSDIRKVVAWWTDGWMITAEEGGNGRNHKLQN